MSDTSVHDAAFLIRFQSVWNRRWRAQLGQVLAGTALLAVVGFGCFAAADYVWELDRSSRLSLLVVSIAGLVMFTGFALWRTLRQSGRPTTAAEIEKAFPVLGQSVRTTVEFGAMPSEQYQSEGVARTLVAALTEQTHQRALPLTIEDVIPTRRLWTLAAGVVVGALVLFGISSSDWEWKNATQRVVMAESAYRTLDVRPGNLTIDEGTGTQIEVALIGRTNREVVLFTRPADTDGKNTEWTEQTLTAQAVAPSKPLIRPHLDLTAKLDRLIRPVEYQVVAGELKSPVYRIDIRRPLRIEQIKVGLTPPAYTRLPTTVTEDANLSALQGTVAQFEIVFDKAVKHASIILAPHRQVADSGEPHEPVTVPLQAVQSGPGGAQVATTFLTTISLTENRHYNIVGEAVDGTTLPETKYRIRVREDQPPQVSIESPEDAVEVHTLVELLMRIRLRDDYGLTKGGLVFQINNEQEVPLISQDFEQVIAAASEAATTGTLSPTTQTSLEKVLPLELFELTQKDSVMYYAFAEDNRPGNSQRTETEMRFIDIRPFKRTFQVIDPDPGMGQGGAGLKTLEELIQRQRFGLNRTMQIEKQAAAGRNPDTSTVDQLMKYETELAGNVRDTAVGLQARGFDDVDSFFQAETAMLAAVDSLSVAKWENATLQMRDALKSLIEQRDRARLFIMKNPQALAQLRQFDRMQAQKLRRPKSDKEEARELIRRLETLIAEENRVLDNLSDDKPGAEATPAKSTTPPPDGEQ